MGLVSSISAKTVGILSWVRVLMSAFLKNMASKIFPVSEEVDGSLQRISGPCSA